MLRAAKCRFGPLTKRYTNGEFRSVDRTAEIELSNDTTAEVKRGVLAGLDRSHSRDYKVCYVSDPVLAVHGKVGDSHQDLKEQLKALDLWMDEFIPIHIPRTGPDGNPAWACGFKSLPRSANRLGRFKKAIKDADPEYHFEGDNGIEAAFPDIQRTLGAFNEQAENDVQTA